MIDERFEPKSDFEAYMKNAILKKGVAGLPAPQSRMEMLLYELVAILETQGASGGGSVTSVAWNAITGKPTVFPPAAHDHNKLYSLLDHNHDNAYSPLSHNHDATYSMAGHNHDVEYYKKTAIDKMFESFNPGTGTPVIPSWDTITGKPETFPPATHTHNEYAKSTHNHDGVYSKTDHSHTEFAANNHNHDTAYATKNHSHDTVYAASNHRHDTTYATITHTHNEYAQSTHTHSGYAATTHNHNDLYVEKASKGTVSDFDTVMEVGKYVVDNNSGVPHAPYSGGIWGSLFVNERNGEPLQVFINAQGSYLATRHYSSTNRRWFDWTVFSDNKHTHSNVDATTVAGKKVWTGNQQAYDSIGVKDANTLYFITEG